MKNTKQLSDLEIEKVLLGTALASSEDAQKICDSMEKGSFSNDNHNVIYDAIKELNVEGKEISAITVAEKLASKGKLDEIGGSKYLEELINSSEQVETSNASNVVSNPSSGEGSYSPDYNSGNLVYNPVSSSKAMECLIAMRDFEQDPKFGNLKGQYDETERYAVADGSAGIDKEYYTGKATYLLAETIRLFDEDLTAFDDEMRGKIIASIDDVKNLKNDSDDKYVIEEYEVNAKELRDRGLIGLDKDMEGLANAKDKITALEELSKKVESGEITDVDEYLEIRNNIEANFSRITLNEAKDLIGSVNKDAFVEDISGALGIEVKELKSMSDYELAKTISEASLGAITSLAVGDVYNVSTGSTINTVLSSIQGEFYRTKEGQKALWNSFIENSDTPHDEENAIGTTEYIKYCISKGREDEWLIEELHGVANIVKMINLNDNFSATEKIVDGETISQIEEYKKTGGSLPYNISCIDGEYYQTNYTVLGEEMLYYMDYHWGENTGNYGENRILTAFSKQAQLDAYERNYKGEYILNHTTVSDEIGTGTEKGIARVQSVKDAERDYYILNGLIKDDKRLAELKAAGEKSFSELVNGISKMDSNGNSMYDFSVEGVSEEDIEKYGLAGAYQMHQNKVIASTLGVASIEGIAGLAKSVENIGDAINMAVHSDANLSGINKEYFGIKKEYNELQEKYWNEFINDKELYDAQLKEYLDDPKTYARAVESFKTAYYDPNTGNYSFKGKTYSRYEDIPADIQQEQINYFMNTSFKKYKMDEWSLESSASSNIYLASFKEGVRNCGNFETFNALDDVIVRNANEQFETMREVVVDKVGDFTDKHIRSKDWYNDMEAHSFVKQNNILGMTANQIGNMALPVLSSMVPGVGQVLSSGLLFTSAFGGAAEESLTNGGNYNQTLQYATLSAATELLIEKAFSGIAGFGEGWMDNVLEYIPNKIINATNLSDSLMTQITKKMLTNGLGEGIEEITTDLVTPLWQSLTYLNEKSYSEIFKENVSFESEVETFLVSFLTSMVFGTSNISRQYKHFNNQMNNLQVEIGKIPGMRETTNKIFAEILATDANMTSPEILNKIIEKNGQQLAESVSKNSDATSQIEALQQKLKEAQEKMNNNQATITINGNEVKLSNNLVLTIADIGNLNGNFEISEEGNITFKNESAKAKFINALYSTAKNQLSSIGTAYTEEIKKHQKELLSKNPDYSTLGQAIQTIMSSETDISKIITYSNAVKVKIGDSEFDVPRSIIEKVNETIENEEEKFIVDESGTELVLDQNSSKRFANGIIGNLKEIRDTQYSNKIVELNRDATSGKYEKAEEVIELLNENNDSSKGSSVVITKAEQVDGKDLIKLEVAYNEKGTTREVNVYVDSATDPNVYRRDSFVGKVSEEISKNEDTKNIYVGKLEYNKKERNIVEEINDDNKSFVESRNNEDKIKVQELNEVYEKEKTEVEKNYDDKISSLTEEQQTEKQEIIVEKEETLSMLEDSHKAQVRHVEAGYVYPTTAFAKDKKKVTVAAAGATVVSAATAVTAEVATATSTETNKPITEKQKTQSNDAKVNSPVIEEVLDVSEKYSNDTEVPATNTIIEMIDVSEEDANVSSQSVSEDSYENNEFDVEAFHESYQKLNEDEKVLKLESLTDEQLAAYFEKHLTGSMFDVIKSSKDDNFKIRAYKNTNSNYLYRSAEMLSTISDENIKLELIESEKENIEVGLLVATLSDDEFKVNYLKNCNSKDHDVIHEIIKSLKDETLIDKIFNETSNIVVKEYIISTKNNDELKMKFLDEFGNGLSSDGILLILISFKNPNEKIKYIKKYKDALLPYNSNIDSLIKSINNVDLKMECLKLFKVKDNFSYRISVMRTLKSISEQEFKSEYLIDYKDIMKSYEIIRIIKSRSSDKLQLECLKGCADVLESEQIYEVIESLSSDDSKIAYTIEFADKLNYYWIANIIDSLSNDELKIKLLNKTRSTFEDGISSVVSNLDLDENKLVFLEDSTNGFSDLEKVTIINSIKSKSLRKDCLSNKNIKLNKDFEGDVIVTFDEKDKLKFLDNNLLSDKSRMTVIKSLSNEQRKKYIKTIHSSEYRAEVITLFESDNEKLVYLNDDTFILAIEDKANIISSIKDDEIKIDFLNNNKDILDGHSKLKIIKSLDDSLKGQYVIGDAWNFTSYGKRLIISSIESNCKMKIDLLKKTKLDISDFIEIVRYGRVFTKDEIEIPIKEQIVKDPEFSYLQRISTALTEETDEEKIKLINMISFDSNTIIELFDKGELKVIKAIYEYYNNGVELVNNTLNDNLKALKIIEVYNSLNENTAEVFKKYLFEEFNGVTRHDKFEITNIEEVAKLITRISTSNAIELRNSQSGFADMLLKQPKPLESLEKVEEIFLRNNLPYVGKVMKVFQTLYSRNLDVINSNLVNMQRDLSRAVNIFKYDVISPYLKSKWEIGDNVKVVSEMERVIFRDLIRISLRSNNKSMKDYIENIKVGNKIFESIESKEDFDNLTPQEKETLEIFASHLDMLYNSLKGRTLSKENLSLYENIGRMKRVFTRNYKYNLPDSIISIFCHEAGFDTIEEVENYMNEEFVKTDTRNREYAYKLLSTNEGVIIDQYDVLKGIGNVKYLESMLQNGIVPGELIAEEPSYDTTPLGIDWWMKTFEGKESLYAALKRSGAIDHSYPIHIVMANEDHSFTITRTNEVKKSEHTQNFIETKIDEETFDLNKPEFYYCGSDQKNKGYDHYDSRTGVSFADIRCIVTDQSIARNNQELYDFTQTIAFEIAKNGYYIPIVDRVTGKVIFTPEEFDILREKMTGMSYYDMNEYNYSETLKSTSDIVTNELFEYLKTTNSSFVKIDIIQEIIGNKSIGIVGKITTDVIEEFKLIENGNIDKLPSEKVIELYDKFKNGEFDSIIRTKINSGESLSTLLRLSELDVVRKRNAVNNTISEVLKEFDLSLKTQIDGDITAGYVEVIDTGSTGRKSNVPGDGDFDFTVRIDADKFNNPEFMSKLSNALRTKFEALENTKTENDPAISKGAIGNDIRYENVKLDGLDVLVDIDISFIQKTNKVEYSTDMSLSDRYSQMDSNTQNLVIANVIRIKQLMKEYGCYKPARKDENQSGLGGVGYENLILQSGGSLLDAAMSFIEGTRTITYKEYLKTNKNATFIEYLDRTKENIKTFSEFYQTYSLWDFGKNHFAEKKDAYPHDNFVDNMTSDRKTSNGYSKIIEAFESYIKSVDLHTEKKNLKDKKVTIDDYEMIDVSKETSTMEEESNNSNLFEYEGETYDVKYLQNLVSSSQELHDAIFASSPPSGKIKRTVLEYIRFLKENNIEIQIDENIEKYYEVNMQAKEQDKVLINDKYILLTGDEGILISHDLLNKAESNREYLYLLHAINSIDYFKGVLQQNFIVFKNISSCIGDSQIIEELGNYENFNKVNSIISKINSATERFGIGTEIVNLDDVIYSNEEPIILKAHFFASGASKSRTLIVDFLEGKIESLGCNEIQTFNIIKECIKYYNEKGIKINLHPNAVKLIKIMDNEDIIVLNCNDVLKGKEPMIISKEIIIDNKSISIDYIMEIIKNKGNAMYSLIKNGSYIGIRIHQFEQFLSEYPEFASLFETEINKYNSLKNKYLYVDGSTYYEFPKYFKNYSTEKLFDSFKSIRVLNEFINTFELSQRNEVINLYNEFIEYLKLEYKDLYEEIEQDINNIISIINQKSILYDFKGEVISPLYNIFIENKNNGDSFGVNQGKVDQVIKTLGINNVIENLFGESIKKEAFLETLKDKDITEEEFMSALSEKHSLSMSQSISHNINILKGLIEQLKQNFEGMTTSEALKFIYLVETEESGRQGVCNVAAIANSIFNKYIGQEEQFENDFGFPMWITLSSGEKILNDARLLIDIYSITNDGILIKYENGKYEIETTAKNYIHLSYFGGINDYAIQKYLDKKGINYTFKSENIFYSEQNIMFYDELIYNIKNRLAQGESIQFSAAGFDIAGVQSGKIQDVGGHIMTVVKVDNEDNLIVDSWGKECKIDLRKELKRCASTYTYNNYSNERKIQIQVCRFVENGGNNITDGNVHKDSNNVSKADNVEMIDVSVISTPDLQNERENKSNVFAKKAKENKNKNTSTNDPLFNKFKTIIDKKDLTAKQKITEVVELALSCDSLSDANRYKNLLYKKFIKKENNISKKELTDDVKKACEEKLRERGYEQILVVNTEKFGEIVIEAVKDFKGDLNGLVDFINKHIPKMIAMYENPLKLEKIVINDTFSPKDCYFKWKTNNSNFEAEATVDYKEGIINLWGSFAESKDPSTLYHEYAHLVQRELSRKHNDFEEKWFNAVKEDDAYITEYAKQDLTEDFAETFGIFHDGNQLEVASKFIHRYYVLSKYNQEIMLSEKEILSVIYDVLNRKKIDFSSTLNEFFKKGTTSKYPVIANILKEYKVSKGYQNLKEHLNLDNGVYSLKENIKINDSIIPKKGMLKKEKSKFNNSATSASIFNSFKKSGNHLFDEVLNTGNITNLNETELIDLIYEIKMKKINLKNYELNSESVRLLIDKGIKISSIYPLFYIGPVNAFIRHFGIDVISRFEELNNGFLLGNGGQTLDDIFKSINDEFSNMNQSDKYDELEKLIEKAINSKFRFNYQGLEGSEFATKYPELFLDENVPQDIKDLYYNKKIDDGNRYEEKYFKYLEGKSIGGVVTIKQIPLSETNYLDYVNVHTNAKRYHYRKTLSILSGRLKMPPAEIQEIFDAKLQELIDDSAFGVRRTINSLEKILDDGKFKNQFEIKTSSHGIKDFTLRMEKELEQIGVPTNLRYEDRPVYGMLLPNIEGDNIYSSYKYLTSGPGSYYSRDDGVIYIFDKEKIINNATISLGDTITFGVGATNMNDPKFFGRFDDMLRNINTRDDLEKFDLKDAYTKFFDILDRNKYYEFQLHGEDSHRIDNIKEILFMKEPSDEIKGKLNKMSIPFRIITKN